MAEEKDNYHLRSLELLHQHLQEHLISKEKRKAAGQFVQKVVSPPEEVQDRNETIGIIGGGHAGLKTGYELKKKGFNVTILEATERPGGRVHTHRAAFSDGLHVEGGAMRIPQYHDLVLDTISELGDLHPDFKEELKLVDFPQENKVIYLSELGKSLDKADFDKGLQQQDPEILRLFPELNNEVKGKSIDEIWDFAFKPVEDANKSPDGIKKVAELFDQYTTRGYLASYMKFSGDTIRLLDVGSAHVVLDVSLIESFLDRFLSSDAGGQDAKLRTLYYGMDKLAPVLTSGKHSSLLNKDIHYGAFVKKVSYKEGGKPQITFEKAGNLFTKEFDRIVFAVPFPVLRQIQIEGPAFSKRKEEAIQSLRYTQVTKILLQFKERWWEKIPSINTGGGGMITDLPIRYAMFPPSSNYTDDISRGVIMASYAFEQDGVTLGGVGEDQRQEVAVRNLETIFPRGNVRELFEVGDSQVWSNKFTGGAAFTYFAPFQYTRLYEPMRIPEWNDKAFFAGEHNSIHHGWIQGAYCSAKTVVDQIDKLPRNA